MDQQGTACDEVYVYSMNRPGFMLQHVLDACAAQTADDSRKPISVMFGLIGLYLYIEKGYSGRRVQAIHRELARKKREWPRVPLPEARGSVTATDVLAVPAGPQRDLAIHDWCSSVWTAFAGNQPIIIALLQEHQLV